MKTIKQVADELRINKQKLYRYIKKNHINDIHHIDNVMYVDDVLENKLYKHFNQETTSTESHQTASNDAEMIHLLKQQLLEKDKQIQQYQELLKNQQILTLQANQKIEQIELKEETKYKKTFFGFYKKVE